VKPYFEQDGITIYHGDCREILPTLSVKAIVSDPPYGMAYVPLRGSDGSKRWSDRLTRRVQGDEKAFDPAHLLGDWPCILWGAHWYADKLPASGGWLVWNKIPNGRKEGFFASDCDMAWTNVRQSTRMFELQWGGEARGGEMFYHPTQKPVSLMSFSIQQLGKVGSIVDPYCGCGPTLAAARMWNIPAIGIEIEERYCEIAANRLRQGVLFANDAVCGRMGAE
jgi:site-specific DNA-methyltransferase (adenine-specific)